MSFDNISILTFKSHYFLSIMSDRRFLLDNLLQLAQSRLIAQIVTVQLSGPFYFDFKYHFSEKFKSLQKGRKIKQKI